MARESSFERREELLTETQREFAQQVRELLHRSGVSYSERVEGNRSEAWYTFHLESNTETAPDVRVYIVDDAFVVEVNNASLYRDRAAWNADDMAGWIADSLNVLDTLLRNPLRVRVRRTWLGRQTGAIWIPDAVGGGAWSGELRACQGKGEEITFASRWYRSTVD